MEDKLFRSASAAGVMLCVALSAAPVMAEPKVGSASFQSVRICSGLPNEINCLGPDNPDPSRKETYVLGGPRMLIDSVISVRPENGGGTIVSRVQDGALDLPIVKSGAFAGIDNRLASTIVTYGGFSFTGPEALPWGVDADMDWVGTGAPLAFEEIANGVSPAGEYGGEGWGAFQLYLFDSAFVPVFREAMEIINFLPFKRCGSEGVLGTSFGYLISPETGPSASSFSLLNGCDGNPILLQPGASYVLFTTMQTIANREGYLDATNTVRVRLSEALPEEVREQLVQQIVTDRSLVPEPGTWAMLIAGFGLLGAMSRRRRAGFTTAA